MLLTCDQTQSVERLSRSLACGSNVPGDLKEVQGIKEESKKEEEKELFNKETVQRA